jgi:hypothetical protein
MSSPAEGRRRYVTGRRDGRSEYVVDEAFPGDAASALPGHRRAVVWGADDVVTVPNDGAAPATGAYFPAPPGWRVVIADVPAGYGVAGGAPATTDASGDDVLDAVGALHATATVDVIVVIAGELAVRLDSGDERVLRAGDSLVQNGLPHAWVNRGDVGATIAVVVVGAQT